MWQGQRHICLVAWISDCTRKGIRARPGGQTRLTAAGAHSPATSAATTTRAARGSRAHLDPEHRDGPRVLVDHHLGQANHAEFGYEDHAAEALDLGAHVLPLQIVGG